MADGLRPTLSRRELLSIVGVAAGSAAMYQAMTALGLAAGIAHTPDRSGWTASRRARRADPRRRPRRDGRGAGIAQGGLRVEVLEYRERAGGRCWTLRGGDRYTELGGVEQEVKFAGATTSIPARGGSRITTTRCSTIASGSASRSSPSSRSTTTPIVHARNAFGGKPQRFRNILSDFHGSVAELLAKATRQDKLDAAGHGRGQGDAARGAAAAGARWTKTTRIGPTCSPATAAASSAIPAAA